MNTCPTCHQPVEETFYFCPNCGHNLQPIPLSTSFSSQAMLYLKSFLLPPFGFIWGYRYLRQSDNASKIVGWVTILLTIVVLVFLIKTTVYTIDTANREINRQVKLYGL